MRIHYTAPAWHGGFYKFMSSALRSLGHEVFYFNDFGTRSQNLFRRIFTRVPRWQYRADDYFRKTISGDWLNSINTYKPDLVIIEHAPNILPEAVREAKKNGYKIFYWIDSPPAGSQAKDVLGGMVAAHKIFSIDRSKEWMTELFPPDKVNFFPLAGEPDVFRPIPSVKKEYDVVFIGSFPPASGDGVIRAEIISHIPDTYNVVVFGNGLDYWFNHYPRLKKLSGGAVRPLAAEKLNEIYNKSNIILSIHSSYHIESVSARVHEAALSGVFQIVDWRKDLDELYPKELIPRFRWAREVNGLIDYWMARPEEREKIAARARSYALSHNTWRQRAEEMLKYF